MLRLAAILNPHADRGRTASLAEQIQRLLAKRVELQLFQTTRRDEAREIAVQAAREGFEGVVAIGGDGTVHEVANGLLSLAENQRPTLGVIPAGSGNDFAFALGIDKAYERTASILANGSTRMVDAAAVATGSGRTCFSINNLGTLLEGQINLASHELQWPRGSGLYLRAVARTLRRRPPIATLQLSVDGHDIARQSSILSISNGCRSGGRFYLVPDARIDDGKFDYIVAKPASRLKLLWEIYRSLQRERAPDDWIERGEFTTLDVTSDIPLAAHVDGEPWLRPAEGERQLSVTVLPGVLRVFAP